MRKIISLVFFGFLMFGIGYIAGHIAGFEKGCKKTLIDVYSLYNVKKMPMNQAIEIAGAGDEGVRKVWEK